MNFVGAEDKVVSFAELCQAQDILRAPDPPQRVVGIAEQEHARVGRHGGFHGLPVEFPVAINLNQGNTQQLAACILVAMQHGRVHRGTNHDFVFRLGAGGACYQGEGRHAAGQGMQPFRLHILNTVVCLEIVTDGEAEFICHERIAVEVVVEPLLKGIDHAGGRFDVHIGNAERERPLEVPFDVSCFPATISRGKTDHGRIGWFSFTLPVFIFCGKEDFFYKNLRHSSAVSYTRVVLPVASLAGRGMVWVSRCSNAWCRAALSRKWASKRSR